MSTFYSRPLILLIRSVFISVCQRFSASHSFLYIPRYIPHQLRPAPRAIPPGCHHRIPADPAPQRRQSPHSLPRLLGVENRPLLCFTCLLIAYLRHHTPRLFFLRSQRPRSQRRLRSWLFAQTVSSGRASPAAAAINPPLPAAQKSHPAGC